MKITIDTHHCSREELTELLDYLEDNSWDFKKESKNILRIGDEVFWRGAFGSQAPKKAVIEHIEITGGGKYGHAVNKVDWSEVYDRNLVVTLDNGHWAYAEQISKI